MSEPISFRRKSRRLCSLHDGRFYTETWFCVLVFVLNLLLVSCATMDIPESKVRAAESYPLKTEHSKLLIAVHPVTDKTEINETFRTNLLDKGILPILVVAENRNPSTSFVLAKNKIAVVNRESVETSTAQRGRVTSETPGSALAMAGAAVISLPLLVVGMKMMSDAQVIEHNLGDKEFYSRTVGPGQKVHGYIYFQLPQGTAALTQHHVLVEVVDSSTGEAMTFDFPISHSTR